MTADRVHAAPSIAQSMREYGRGLAGGLIFSLPLLYTMEVWWAGLIASPERMIAFLAFIFILLLGYNRHAGMRNDASWIEIAIDSVEELGLGIVTSALALFLTGRIGPQCTLDEALGLVIVEAGVVAIGFSVGTAQLGADSEGESGMGAKNKKRDDADFTGQIVITISGAVLFASNVAPTEEILLIAVETAPVRLLGLFVLSLMLTALILYFSEFTRAHRYAPIEKKREAAAGTIITYAIALAASALILWFFGRFDGQALDVIVAEIVVLGLPATLGASAGRLLMQS
ncbi:MAG TPA: TIGR02587 family membrane protein [Thermoanaerobaculia bacterium]